MVPMDNRRATGVTLRKGEKRTKPACSELPWTYTQERQEGVGVSKGKRYSNWGESVEECTCMGKSFRGAENLKELSGGASTNTQ